MHSLSTLEAKTGTRGPCQPGIHRKRLFKGGGVSVLFPNFLNLPYARVCVFEGRIFTKVIRLKNEIITAGPDAG